MSSERKETYPSTFTIDNFSSTTALGNNELKLPIGNVEEKVYNPYEHRRLEHPNTFFGAFVHLLKGSLGTGILAMPMAFKNAGLVVGLIGTIFIGILCTHTVHILVVASQRVCQKAQVPSLGFAESAEAVFRFGPKKFRLFARSARIFVEVALVLTYYAANIIYVVFITLSINKVVSSYYPETSDWTIYYKLMILLPLIICCQIRNLKHLVPFSFIANTTMIIAFSITLYYMFEGISDVNMSDIKMTKDMTTFPLFFSTVLCAMEGIGTIMPVENSMIKPKFIGCPGVLNLAMVCVVTLYASIGFFGYLRFGDATEPSVTNNLPPEIAASVAQACISIAVFFTFMLQFYVPVDITWRRIERFIPEKRRNVSQIVLRTGLLIVITAIAMAAGDNLGPLIELVGAVFFSILGLLVPAVLDIIVKSETGFGIFKWRLLKNVLIILLALFALISGSYYSIKEMIREHRH